MRLAQAAAAAGAVPSAQGQFFRSEGARFASANQKKSCELTTPVFSGKITACDVAGPDLHFMQPLLQQQLFLIMR